MTIVEEGEGTVPATEAARTVDLLVRATTLVCKVGASYVGATFASIQVCLIFCIFSFNPTVLTAYFFWALLFAGFLERWLADDVPVSRVPLRPDERGMGETHRWDGKTTDD
jgi:hypothetical protein